MDSSHADRESKRLCPAVDAAAEPTLSPKADDVEPAPLDTSAEGLMDSASNADSPRETKRVCPTIEVPPHASEPTMDTSPKVDSVEPTLETSPEDALLPKARAYQEYMKGISVPRVRRSVIPFTSWSGLGMSMKELYKQPFHYLTNIHLRQLDKMRLGAEDEDTPLDFIVHPLKAEATIWLMEENHRKTASPDQLARLWLLDPMYHMYIDPVPQE